MPLDLTAPWWSLPLVILDFETTGVDPEACEPVSVAVVRYENAIEVDRFYSLLRPACPIPPEATAIHGITDALAAEAPQMVDVLPDLARVGALAIPCGYNAIHFDRLILHRYVEAPDWFDVPMFDPAQQWVDPLVIVRKVDRYVGGKGSHRLAATCERWDCPMPEEEQHNALGDVRGTFRLLQQLITRGRLKTATSARRITEYTHELAAKQNADFDRWLRRKRAAESQTKLDLGGGDGSDASNGGDGSEAERTAPADGGG